MSSVTPLEKSQCSSSQTILTEISSQNLSSPVPITSVDQLPGLNLVVDLGPHTSNSCIQGRQEPIMTRSMIRASHDKPSASLIETSPIIDPSTFNQAVKFTEWRHAMVLEINSLLQQGTWTLVPWQPHINIVGSKWVFKIKRRANGSLERYKALLVAKGFHREYGETFSPVVKSTKIRVMISMAVSFSWKIRQLNVNNAFLNGILQDSVHGAT